MRCAALASRAARGARRRAGASWNMRAQDFRARADVVFAGPCSWEEVGVSISMNGSTGPLSAQKSLLGVEGATQKTLSHLSSGKKVENAQDNAANLAIAVQMVSQLASSNQD